MAGDNINESEHASSCPEPNTTPTFGIPQPSAAQPSHSRPPLQPNSAENDFIDLEPDDTGTQSRKPRQLKSIVWHHFRRVMVNGEQKADCLHCNQRLSATSKNGTSHLKDHVEKRCPKKHIKVDIRQQFLNYNLKKDGSVALENSNFNQEVSRKELATMVVMHEYPLAIVDHVGFRRFVHCLNPNFKLISRNTLKNDIMKMYANERVTLKKLFEDFGARIAITTDMWTASHQKRGYMVVTAHFIDEEWVLHNKTLR